MARFAPYSGTQFSLPREKLSREELASLKRKNAEELMVDLCGRGFYRAYNLDCLPKKRGRIGLWEENAALAARRKAAEPMNVQVKFDGTEIIVTRPGTDTMTAYRKASDRPNLILTRSWVDPHSTSPAVSEFRAHAFQAAVSKARELGWIV